MPIKVHKMNLNLGIFFILNKHLYITTTIKKCIYFYYVIGVPIQPYRKTWGLRFIPFIQIMRVNFSKLRDKPNSLIYKWRTKQTESQMN